MIAKSILFCGCNIVLMCDAKCEKAFGINNRPRLHLSENEDDYVLLADHELGTAPIDPGTYEGDCAKPRKHSTRLNTWCARECERSAKFELSTGIIEFKLKDFAKRVNNILSKNE